MHTQSELLTGPVDPQLQRRMGQMHTHTHACTDKLEVHVHPPHLNQSYLRPPPLLLLFELQGSLISGPASLLLDGSAVAEW